MRIALLSRNQNDFLYVCGIGDLIAVINCGGIIVVESVTVARNGKLYPIGSYTVQTVRRCTDLALGKLYVKLQWDENVRELVRSACQRTWNTDSQYWPITADCNVAGIGHYIANGMY